MSETADTTEALPAVSVVVAAYSAAATIADCLRSLVALDYPEDRLELIVVDNCSTDDTAAIVRDFAPQVILLSEPRRGASAARNRGIASSSGHVVAFTDADCTVDPRWLAELVPALADPDVGIAGGRIRAFYPITGVADLAAELHDQERAIRSPIPYAVTASWASPKHVIEAAGGFNETLLRCQDVDLAYRVVRAGHSIEYVDRAVVSHRDPSSLWGTLRRAHLQGRGVASLRRIHPDLFARLPPRRSAPRRTLSAIGRLREARDWRHAIFRLVVDLGKISGEIRGEFT